MPQGVPIMRTRAARRIAAAAAFGGGGVGVLTGATLAVLYTEARIARRSVGLPSGSPPSADGIYGPPGDTLPQDANGIHGVTLAGADTPPDGMQATGTPYALATAVRSRPITFAVLGDSTAAGLGVHEPMETPGALLASGVAAIAERPVRLVNVALTGAQSSDLERQATLALAEDPDVALIMIGANDVTHRMSPADSVRHLADAARRISATGCEVVVATCPDLGTIEPIPQPLRFLARRWSRQLAAAQTIAVVEAGGRTVSLGALLGPEFEARPRDLFGPDRFHPSVEGYATAAMAVLPSLCAALDLWPAEEERPDSFRGEGVLPIAQAAVEAVEQGGTEVAGTRVGGAERGPRGRWVLLRHRRRRRIPAPAQTPDQENDPANGASEQDPATDATSSAQNSRGTLT